VVPVRESTVTVIFTLRDEHPDLSAAVATPLQFVVLVMLSVVVGGRLKLPKSAVNVTTLLHTGFWQESLTVAVMMEVSNPSARMVAGARVTFSVAREPAETVRLEVSLA
jgi:hypothetical protein